MLRSLWVASRLPWLTLWLLWLTFRLLWVAFKSNVQSMPFSICSYTLMVSAKQRSSKYQCYCLWFYPNPSGVLEPVIYHMQGKHTNDYTTDVMDCTLDLQVTHSNLKVNHNNHKVNHGNLLAKTITLMFAAPLLSTHH
jgi:hypothetical protein